MTHITELALVILFAVQAVGTVTYLFLISRLFSRLEREHTEVCETLGNPSLCVNNSIQTNTRFLRWLWRKDFAALDDPVTVTNATVVRTLFMALAANFIALLLAVLGVALHA